MARIVVVGAGVGGLATALFASRSGHHVTIVERDDTPLPTDPDGAFDWDRHGAPQVRHSHAFLARLRNLLRDRHPDVLDALFAAGATELRFMDMLPEHMDRTPQQGDEDLVALACRRTTFEWVLRRIVTASNGIEIMHGTPVTALRALRPAAGTDLTGTPTVTGVVLSDGTTLDADVVVGAGGRRMDVPALLGEVGATIEETTEDTGIIYMSRFFRLLDGAEFPPQVGPIGGDLGYLRYGVFPGDNRTFSVTLAIGTDDGELRRLLVDDDTFLTVAGALTATAPYVESDRSEPITGVEVMGGLINRRRRFLDDEERPCVLGFHVVGDAHTATNPLYGRGCSLAMVQAQLLVDLLAVHGATTTGSHVERSIAYEYASDVEIIPWYQAAVDMDRLARSAAITAAVPAADTAVDTHPSAESAATDDAGPIDPVELARSILHEGLLPAMRSDPVVLRAFLRMFNLLTPPDALITDPDIVGRVMAVYASKDDRPPEPDLGPDRAGLLAAIHTHR